MRIVVAEDSMLFREGLVRLLQERGHQVVAAVGDADSLWDAVVQQHPDVVQALVRGRNAQDALGSLSDRERQVLAVVAEGHSNTAAGRALGLSDRTVEAHLRSVFTKLDLYDDGTTNRRVRAVIAYLESRSSP